MFLLKKIWSGFTLGAFGVGAMLLCGVLIVLVSTPVMYCLDRVFGLGHIASVIFFIIAFNIEPVFGLLALVGTGFYLIRLF